MKSISISKLFLAAGLLFFSSCKKNLLEMSGSASEANFTFAQIPPSDTLPYPVRVRFTNNSTDAFLYQWNFGDNSNLNTEASPIHTYRTGGTYNVSLLTVGTNGNSTVTRTVTVTDACSNDFFSKLTTCTFADWTWSTDGDAIRVLSPDATQVFFAGSAAGCQADDIFRFNRDGSFAYDANGQTFSVQAGYNCVSPVPNATSFQVIARTGQRPQILLRAPTGVRPFLGTTDPIENNLYTVISYDENRMTLRGVLEGTGGVLIEIKLRKNVALTLNDIRNLLTGGSSKSWKLDATPGANPIIVGTEGNPSEFFGGGALADCQEDDVYTFTSANVLNYNANGATLNGGNIAPNFNCGADRSFSGSSYTFGATTGGVAGLATIQLPGTPPNRFIGVTDVPAENVYRIIEITPTRMVLRAGNGSGVVFQFKFVAL